MKRLGPLEWSRFQRLRRLYPDLTQVTLAQRFGISLDTVKAHWWDHEGALVPAETSASRPVSPSPFTIFPLSRF